MGFIAATQAGCLLKVKGGAHFQNAKTRLNYVRPVKTGGNMKTSKNTQLVLKGLFASAVLVAFTSCGPQTKTSSSVTKPDASQGIIGGVNADLDYQKENGIVGIIAIERPLDLKTCKIVKDPKTGEDSLDLETCQPEIDERTGKPKVQQSICTGTLIEKKIILTAAHCIDSPFLVGAYAVFTTDMEKADQTTVREIITGAVHADYMKDVKDTDAGMQTTHNDIALVGFNKEAPADFKLAKLALNAAKELEKTSLTLTGFGVTNAIVSRKVVGDDGKEQILHLPSEGSGTLRKVDNIVVTEVSVDQKEIMLDQKNLAGACHGDSGGPAFSKLADGSTVQVGVTSRGTEELGNCDQGAIYTAVSGYADWIKEKSKIINEQLAFSK